MTKDMIKQNIERDTLVLVDNVKIEDLSDKTSPVINPEPIRMSDAFMLMVKNESTLYAYWQLSERKKQVVETHFHKPWHDLSIALRLYDVTNITDFSKSSEYRSFTIYLGKERNHLFISELEPNCTYVADIGIATGKHHFFTVVRSNSVHTPRVTNTEYKESSVVGWNYQQGDHRHIIDHFSTYTYYETKVDDPKK